MDASSSYDAAVSCVLEHSIKIHQHIAQHRRSSLSTGLYEGELLLGAGAPSRSKSRVGVSGVERLPPLNGGRKLYVNKQVIDLLTEDAASLAAAQRHAIEHASEYGIPVEYLSRHQWGNLSNLKFLHEKGKHLDRREKVRVSLPGGLAIPLHTTANEQQQDEDMADGKQPDGSTTTRGAASRQPSAWGGHANSGSQPAQASSPDLGSALDDDYEDNMDESGLRKTFNRLGWRSHVQQALVHRTMVKQLEAQNRRAQVAAKLKKAVRKYINIKTFSRANKLEKLAAREAREIQKIATEALDPDRPKELLIDRAIRMRRERLEQERKEAEVQRMRQLAEAAAKAQARKANASSSKPGYMQPVSTVEKLQRAMRKYRAIAMWAGPHQAAHAPASQHGGGEATSAGASFMLNIQRAPVGGAAVRPRNDNPSPTRTSAHAHSSVHRKPSVLFQQHSQSHPERESGSGLLRQSLSQHSAKQDESASTSQNQDDAQHPSVSSTDTVPHQDQDKSKGALGLRRASRRSLLANTHAPDKPSHQQPNTHSTSGSASEGAALSALSADDHAGGAQTERAAEHHQQEVGGSASARAPPPHEPQPNHHATAGTGPKQYLSVLTGMPESSPAAAPPGVVSNKGATAWAALDSKHGAAQLNIAAGAGHGMHGSHHGSMSGQSQEQPATGHHQAHAPLGSRVGAHLQQGEGSASPRAGRHLGQSSGNHNQAGAARPGARSVDSAMPVPPQGEPSTRAHRRSWGGNNASVEHSAPSILALSDPGPGSTPHSPAEDPVAARYSQQPKLPAISKPSRSEVALDGKTHSEPTHFLPHIKGA